jgi:hypothetical protein
MTPRSSSCTSALSRQTRRPRSARDAALAVLAALFTGLTGCSGTSPVALPSGVSVEVHQYRSDRQTRALTLGVRNDSTADITITAARFSSPAFARPADWPKDETTIPAGVKRDLRVSLPDAVCDVTDAMPRVILRFSLPSGVAGEATLRAGDPYDSLERILGEDCDAAAVAAVVEVEGTALRVQGSGAASVGHLTVELRPQGGRGRVRLVGVASTLLITSPDRLGWPLNVTVAGGAPPSSVELPLVPNRCDPHAVAEDKVGTRFPVEALTGDGVARRFPLRLAEGMRTQLLRFVAQHCGFGD